MTTPYFDLAEVYRVHAEGGSIVDFLRSTLGAQANTDVLLEVLYDVRAGADVAYYADHRDARAAYEADVAAVLVPHARAAETVLEVGCGEGLTLAAVAPALAGAKHLLGCDLSWSRIASAVEFVRAHTTPDIAAKVDLFVGNLFALPFADAGIDVVWTAHAIELNGGREREALSELLRVTRNVLCLFEPCYEAGSPEAQQRMDRFGFVRGLAATIAALGGSVESCVPIAHPLNPLNPTHAFIVRPPPRPRAAAPAGFWACPATRLPLVSLGDVMFCERSGLAYPILRGIPVLRAEAGILATALRHRSPSPAASA